MGGTRRFDLEALSFFVPEQERQTDLAIVIA